MELLKEAVTAGHNIEFGLKMINTKRIGHYGQASQKHFIIVSFLLWLEKVNPAVLFDEFFAKNGKVNIIASNNWPLSIHDNFWVLVFLNSCFNKKQQGFPWMFNGYIDLHTIKNPLVNHMGCRNVYLSFNAFTFLTS